MHLRSSLGIVVIQTTIRHRIKFIDLIIHSDLFHNKVNHSYTVKKICRNQHKLEFYFTNF